MENDKWKMENVLSDPYGKALLEWSATNDTGLNTRKFTGYERDATGLDYANARTYASERGRFIQPDPLGLRALNVERPESLNRYAYVSNDSINLIDPGGTLECIAWQCSAFKFYFDGAGRDGHILIGGKEDFAKDPTGRSGGGIDDQRPCSEINEERNKIKREVVEEYLKKSGLDEFILKKDPFKAGYMITFKEPREVKEYINKHPELFEGGGGVGGAMHAGDLKGYFGEGLGGFADWRTFKTDTSTTNGLGNRSLQAVLYGPGAFVDTDRWNPYEGDAVNFLFHLFGEVLGKKYINSWRRCPED